MKKINYLLVVALSVLCNSLQLQAQEITETTRKSPFFSAEVGMGMNLLKGYGQRFARNSYGFSLRSDIKGGMMLKLSLGVTHRFSSRTAVYAGIYGSLQNLSGDGMREINAWGDVYTYNGHTTTQQAGVKVALRF